MDEILQIAQDFGEGFDEVRKTLLGPDAKLVLLKEKGDTTTFDTVDTIESAWQLEFSEFLGASTFKVADISVEFGKKVRGSDHLMVIDSKLPELNNTIFETLAETSSPSTNVPWWSIRAQGLGRKYIDSQEL